MLRKMSTSAMSSIASNLKIVNDKIAAAGTKRPELFQYTQPRLVAVSKTKSVDMIMEAYDAGQRHFGENYVVELVEKANDIELLDRCQDIKWHFIGHLQRNKINKVLGIPNLYAVETIDSERLAKSVNDAWIRLKKIEPLEIMVQVNTSGETNKNGVPLGETSNLVAFIKDNCPSLKIMGLMTIGEYGYDTNAGLNPDFLALVKEREEVCKTFNYMIQDLGLSMGMSTDYEQAIEMGSTNVRIGSTIFGARNKPPGIAEQKEQSKESANPENKQQTSSIDSSGDAISEKLNSVAIG